MCFWGWVAAGGATGRARRATRAHDVVQAAAALELLHVFALIHDDVMDESASRRGQPSVHALAAQLHLHSGARGDAQRFGESIAVLVGDLAHAEADHLVAELPGADAPASGGCWSSSWSTARAATSSAPRPAGAISAMPAGRPDEVGQLHRAAAAAARRGRRRRPTARRWPALAGTATSWARRSRCATTCSASGAIRRGPASRPATTCSPASRR